MSARRNTIEKQHTCVRCGCVFRYRVNPRDPLATMCSSIMGNPKDIIANHPCPGCGLIQPEMVMWSKVWHPLASLAALVAVIVFAAFSAAKGGPPALVAPIALGVFLTLGLIQLFTAFNNPNANQEANRTLAQEEVERGNLELARSGPEGQANPTPRNLTIGHVLAIPLLLAGPLAFLYPLMCQAGEQAAPTNPGLNPAIVAPGDTVSYTLTGIRAEGINGSIWRGQPTVLVQNAAKLGTRETLEAEGSNRQWGRSLRVPKGSRNAPLAPTIRFKIPEQPALAGQTLRLSVTIHATFPVINGRDWANNQTFDDRTAILANTLEVHIADRAAVARRRDAYLLGVAGGAVFLLGSMWLTMLAAWLQRSASRSEVVSAPLGEQGTHSLSASAECHYPPPGAADLDRIDTTKWQPRWPR